MQPLAIIRSQDDLVEAFRARKDALGLSNRFCDEVGGLSSGHTDKVIGPSRKKQLSAMIFDLFCELFAVEFHMSENLDAAARMESRWEAREARNVRVENGRVSKKLVERAKPLVAKEMGSVGGKQRAALLSAKQKSGIAQKGAKAKWRKWRRERRSKRPATPDDGGKTG